MLPAGRLHKQVEIQSRSTVTDEVGQATLTWNTVAIVWAEVQAVRGREFFAAAQTQMENSIKVRIRMRDDIDQTCRLVYQGKFYDITGIIPIERDTMLELICLQGVKDGR